MVVCHLLGTPNLQCLILRQLCYLQPIQYKNFLAVPQLRARDLCEMARSDEPTGFELGVVLAELQNLKVKQMSKSVATTLHTCALPCTKILTCMHMHKCS